MYSCVRCCGTCMRLTLFTRGESRWMAKGLPEGTGPSDKPRAGTLGSTSSDEETLIKAKIPAALLPARDNPGGILKPCSRPDGDARKSVKY